MPQGTPPHPLFVAVMLQFSKIYWHLMRLHTGVWVKRPEGGRGFNEFLLIGHVLQIRCTVAAAGTLEQSN